MTDYQPHPDFVAAFDDALDEIPQELFDRIENVVFEFAPEPTPTQQDIVCGSELMGLYTGTPLPERGQGYGTFSLPSRIWIFVNPIMRVSHGDHDATVERIRRVVLHEIGHYFGMSDEQLRRKGY